MSIRAKFLVVILYLSFSLSSYANTSKPFLVGNLTGQLGNQMFIIATTLSCALDNDAIPVFPDLIYREEDNTLVNYKYVFFRLKTHLPSPVVTHYCEPYFHYSKIPYTAGMSLNGYFQSEKYFKHHKKEITESFAPSLEISNYLYRKYKKLLCRDLTVAIHVRSYIDYDPEENIYIQQKLSYFEKAISLFPDHAIFLIFSNDVGYSKKIFSNLKGNFYFIEGEAYYLDFYLMSMCKHNIISNSSFSWWSAYLNANPKKIVIAPNEWFSRNSNLDSKDIYPEDWIRINN